MFPVIKPHEQKTKYGSLIVDEWARYATACFEKLEYAVERIGTEPGLQSCWLIVRDSCTEYQMSFTGGLEQMHINTHWLGSANSDVFPNQKYWYPIKYKTCIDLDEIKEMVLSIPVWAYTQPLREKLSCVV